MTAHRDAQPPVTIVGAGPVGLSLAVALARHGVRTALLEKKPATSEYSKAPAIHVRTREAFRQWGIDERFLAAGTLRRAVTLHSPADERALFTIDFGQLDAVLESGLCDVHFDTTAVDVRSGPDDVEVRASSGDGEIRFRSEFVVGCDGASSTVRDAIGQPFSGSTYALRPMLADVAITDERDRLAWPRAYNGSKGITTIVRIRRSRSTADRARDSGWASNARRRRRACA